MTASTTPDAGTAVPPGASSPARSGATPSSTLSSSCRLTVVSTTMRVDLAVPLHLTVAELLATVIASLGRDAADQGAAAGGWVLQRGGDAPLEATATLAASKLRDGDVLHLRTRATQLPEVAFDDVLDAVATGVLTRSPRWQPTDTERATTTLAALATAFALALLVGIGPDWLRSAIVSGVASVLLVITAVALDRIASRRAPAVTAGALGVAAAVVCGATAIAGSRRLVDFGAPQLLVGVSAAVLVAAVLLVTVRSGAAGWLAIVTAGLLVAIGTGVASGTTLTPAGTAALIAAVALAVSPLLPAAALRLARVRLPSLPSDAADLQRDTGTLEPRAVLAQAVRADQYLTGLVGGTAVALAAAALVTSVHGVSDRILAAVLALICLLRARLFTGRAQRLLLVAAGAVGLLAVGVAGVASVHGLARVLAFAVPALVLALVLFSLSVTLPGRRYTPPLSRAADIVESLLVLSVIPLALAVMGVYGAIRGTTAGH